VLAQSVVRAPAAGTVYHLDAGARSLSKRQAAASVGRPAPRAGEGYFDEPEIGRLAVGQKIQITWTPSKVISGTDTSS